MKRKMSGTLFGFLGLIVLAGAVTAGVFVVGYVLDNPAIDGELSVIVYTGAGALAVLTVFLGLAFVWMADVVNELTAIRAALAAAAARSDRVRPPRAADVAMNGAHARGYADRAGATAQPAAPQHTNGAEPAPAARPQTQGGYDDAHRRTMSMEDRIAARMRPPEPEPRLAEPALASTRSFREPAPAPARNGYDRGERPLSIGRDQPRDTDRDALRALRYTNGHGERTMATDDPDVAAMQRSGRPLRRRPTPRDPAAELDALLREQERPRGEEDDGYRVVRPGAGRTPY